MTMTPEQKAKLIGQLVKYGLYALAAFLAVPFLITAIKGWLLLVALVALIGGTLAIQQGLAMMASN